MAFEVPVLPYDYSVFEPFISEQTMRLHHDKHHQTYVDRLNAAIEKHPDWASKPIHDIIANLNSVPDDVRTAVRNHGGGHLNHWMFWEIMAPKGSTTFKGPLADAIQETFGGMDQFREQFNTAAANHFGSGWVWLVHSGGQLKIVTTPNQDSPVTDGHLPILMNDLWEHAYYLTYQNRKAEYFEAWFNVINWTEANRRFEQSKVELGSYTT